MYNELKLKLSEIGLSVSNRATIDITELKDIKQRIINGKLNGNEVCDIIRSLEFIVLEDWKSFVEIEKANESLVGKLGGLFNSILIFINGNEMNFSCYIDRYVLRQRLGKNFNLAKETEMLAFLFNDWEVVSLFLSEEEKKQLANIKLKNFVNNAVKKIDIIKNIEGFIEEVMENNSTN